MESLSLMLRNGKTIQNTMAPILEIIEQLNGFGKSLEAFNNKSWGNFYIFVLVLPGHQLEDLRNVIFIIESYRQIEGIQADS